MKKNLKEFLMSCNDDKDNQLCYPVERKMAEKAKKKGFIKKITEEFSCQDGEFYIYLSKKGVKKVKKLMKKKPVENSNEHYS